MKERTDLSKTFEIDRDQLDIEWVGQPKLYFEFAAELADKNAELERAKSKLEIVKANLSLDAREDPKHYGIIKVSDKAVEAAIIKRKEYRIQLKHVISIRHELEILQAAVKALDHRKKALESLVFLHGQNYFSSPRALDKKSKDATDEITKRSIRRRGKEIEGDNDD